jgi:uncharacterized protein with HEPN domain
MKIDLPRINFVLDVILDIGKSMDGVSRAAFDGNLDKKDANLRRIEVISEVIGSISEELKVKHVDIEWKKFSEAKNSFRNQYFGVDWDIVWEILKKDIPVLKTQIEGIRDEIDS